MSAFRAFALRDGAESCTRSNGRRTEQDIALEYSEAIAPARGVSAGGKITLLPGQSRLSRSSGEKDYHLNGDNRENEGCKKGVLKSARKAAAVAVSIRGANQRAAAEKVWRAIESLLPTRAAKPKKKRMRAASKTGLKPNSNDNGRNRISSNASSGWRTARLVLLD